MPEKVSEESMLIETQLIKSSQGMILAPKVILMLRIFINKEKISELLSL